MADPTPLDALISTADRALRAVFAPATSARPDPAAAAKAAHSQQLNAAERREAAALMRVNHAGEVAAQALYHGQAFAARNAQTREWLLSAAREEADHLAWCDARLKSLDSRPSALNPLWYAGSFAIGALAASLGDRASLGFVVETERQVEQHLGEHLAKISAKDSASRAVLEAMRSDEVHHGQRASDAGAIELPWPIRALMRATARVMTVTSYWI